MGIHDAVLEFNELYHWRYVNSDRLFVKPIACADYALVQTRLKSVNVAVEAGFRVNRMVVSLSLKIKDETGRFFFFLNWPGTDLEFTLHQISQG